MTLSLFTSSQLSPGPAAPRPRPSIEERFAQWSVANQHVLDELLRLAREKVDAGASFVSTKALWESARASLSAGKDAGYKLNNDFTAPAARWLIAQDVRLSNVIEIRKTKP